MRRHIYSVHTIVIDEVSMVSATMFDFTHRRPASKRNSDNLFGGLNVILVDDFLQLRHAKGYYAFENGFLWSAFETI